MRASPVVPLVLLAFAGATQAMNLEPSGQGEVLISPYYTVNNDHQTQVSIANRGDRGKALKVRFLEGMNGREVFAFNLYLAPHDLWTAALFAQSATGPATLITLDDSCTVPALKTSFSLPQLPNGRRIAPFSNAQYNGARDDAGPNDLARTREGYFEIIEMGEVVNAGQTTLSDISPGSDGIPLNCVGVANAWASGGYWASNSETDLLPPAGGLSAAVSLVDVLGGSMYSFPAEAIDSFSTIVQHTAPNSAVPNLSSGVTSTVEGYVEAIVDIRGQLSTARYPLSRAIDAVSALFMASSIESEFTTAANIGAESDWLVGMPTRKFYTDGVGSLAILPFTKTFQQSFIANDAAPPQTSDPRGEEMKLVFHNREGETADRYCEEHPEDTSELCNPGLPVPIDLVRRPSLYWSSTVITFNRGDTAGAPDSMFGSQLRQNIETEAYGIVEGAVSLDLFNDEAASFQADHQLRGDLTGRHFVGLPVIALWAFKVTNTNVVPGVLGNYASIRRHRSITDFQLGQ